MRFGTDEFYFKSKDEMRSVFRHCPEAIANTMRVAEMCHLVLSFEERHFPVFKSDENISNEELLRRLCYEGIRRTYPDLPPHVKQRLETELNIIKQMGYVSYFLIVWDFVRFARERGIPSGMRGSGVGSLVAHAL
ncbi:MAG: DNA polymerase III subunit alpha, partial [Deltaproteobacteria bacterium]